MAGGVGVVAVLALAGCRPEVSFDLDGRQSQIDHVAVTAVVRPDGVVHVDQRYTFASDDGGTVAVPDLADASGIIGGSTNVTVDSRPVTPSGGTFSAELSIESKHATVGYDLVGEVKRYTDVATVELDVLPAPDDTSRQDPDVKLTGTLTLPESPGPVDAHLHGGRDRSVTVAASVITFSADAPIWQPFHRLAVAFPPGAVPYVAVTPIPFLASFQQAQQAQDLADTTTDSVLSSVDTQEDLSRWIITAVAFGLPAIFWTIVAVGLVRRLRERRCAVGSVPDQLSDPPTADDPAVVAVLDGEGHPAKEAVAGTILALAQRKAVDVQQYGDTLVVKVPLTTMATNGSEELVLDALRGEATPEGVVEGPLWRTPTRWWRAYKRDAIKRARGMGLVTRWLPLAPLSGALITTGIGISLFFFTNPTVYFIIVFGVQIVGYVISFVSGYTLTNKGWRQRALWRSFARYIDHQGKLDRDVGPAGVVIWGPYLVYGAVLGAAHGAAKPLTP
jgi:hypothetical protein